MMQRLKVGDIVYLKADSGDKESALITKTSKSKRDIFFADGDTICNVPVADLMATNRSLIAFLRSIQATSCMDWS